MKSRSLKRIFAVFLVICMLGCEMSVFATQDTNTGAESGVVDTDNDTDVAEDEKDTDAPDSVDAPDSADVTGTDEDGEKADADADDKKPSGSGSISDDYVNERLEKNYTNVSSKYTSDKYKGDPIKTGILDAYVSTVNSDGNTVDSLTEETNNYTGSDKVVMLEMGDIATFKITAPKKGVYVLGFDEINFDESSILSVEMTFTLNGEVPFYECNRLVFLSQWKDREPDKDRYGNEIVSLPEKVIEWQKAYIKDVSYRYSTPLMVELEEGENVITMKITEGSVKIGDFYLEEETVLPDYDGTHKAEGNFYQALRAERPAYRNDSSIRPSCEYDCDLDPYNPNKKVLNILEESSFADAGMQVSYEVNVESDGYYYIGYNYRQTGKIDFPVFMNIYVDGVIPNKELSSYQFYYAKDFTKKTITDSNKKKMGIYLTKGTHLITFELSNDLLRESLETFDRIMSEVNDTSLDITKIAGTGQDKYRDINIKSYIPDIDDRLAGWIKELEDAYDYLSDFSKVKNCGTISSLDTAIDRLYSLAKNPNKIPYRRDELATGTSSVNQDLADVINKLNGDGVSFDTIYIYQEGSKNEIPGKTNFFVKIWESIKRFFASFNAQAYSTSDITETSLQVWIARPRQYLEIIQQLVDKYFTPQTGIHVDLAIMPDAGKLILSNAAGNAPDVAQAIDYTQPYEFAVRNALVDMTKFDDFDEVMGRFPEGLLIPSVYDGGIYSMPETFYFWVLYYRTDILEKLGLEVPNTIEEVQNLIPALKNRGLEFYYPTAGTTGQRSFAMMTPILYQSGASLYQATDKNYREDAEGAKAPWATAIDSEATIKGLETLTELFTIYDIPQDTPSFFQHFRMGDMPVGIADYFMYSQLINAAPEIENSWEIALVPGIETTDSNGNTVVNRMTAGAAQNSIIMKSTRSEKIVLTDGSEMERDQAAWEYLKWWMSTDVQVEFGNTLQTTYGKEYIWNSANIEAFGELPWKSRDKGIVIEQMNNIVESPRIPGTYMLERELSNAYIEVVINGGILRTAIDTAVKRIDRETRRKLQEFGYLDSNGNTIKEYEIPSLETVRKILAKGKKSN